MSAAATSSIAASPAAAATRASLYDQTHGGGRTSASAGPGDSPDTSTVAKRSTGVESALRESPASSAPRATARRTALLVRGGVNEALPLGGVVENPALHELPQLGIAHERDALVEHVFGDLVLVAQLGRGAFREREHGIRRSRTDGNILGSSRASASAWTRANSLRDRRGSVRTSDPIRTGRARFEATPARAACARWPISTGSAPPDVLDDRVRRSPRRCAAER